MKPTEYLTVRESDFVKFDAEVNKRLREDYVLYCSPYVSEAGEEFLVCQAMTREPKVNVGALR